MSRLESHGPVGIYSTAHPERFRLVWLVDGKRSFRRANGLDAARALAVRLAAQIERGGPLPPETFGELTARYLEVGLPGWGERYVEQRVWASRCHVVPVLGMLTLEEFSPRHVSMMLEKMARGGYARTSIGHVLRLIRDVVSWGAKQGFWPPGRDPLAGVRLPVRAGGAQVGLRRVPDEEIPTASQVRALAEALAERRAEHGLMAEFAAASGLRWGELIALRARDVDPAGVVSVTRQLRETNSTILPALPKTRAGVRHVVIPPDLAARVRELDRPGSDDGLLFVSPHGRPWRRSSFNRRFLTPARGRIDWPEQASWHGLRHHAISMWLHAKMSPADAARMAGHSSAQVTLAIYAGSDADWLERVRRLLDQ